MRQTIRIEGLKELDRALGELKPATGKALLRRVATARLQPIADDARARAPKRTGKLKTEIGVGVRLSKSQQKGRRKESTVEVFAGAGPVPQAIQDEFGNSHQAAQPFLRPAWDAGRAALLEGVTADLGAAIQKAAARAAKRSR